MPAGGLLAFGERLNPPEAGERGDLLDHEREVKAEWGTGRKDEGCR